MASHPSEAPHPERLRVVRGEPTDEELAAVVAALSVVAAREQRPAESAYERWRRGRLAALRRPPSPDLRRLSFSTGQAWRV